MKQLLIMRQRARGDILLCTPIVRTLSELDPEFKINFQTDYPEILRDNPYVFKAGRKLILDKPCVLNLEVAYEKMPGWHLIDAFAHAAGFGPGVIERRLQMYPNAEEHAWAVRMTQEGHNLVMIAPGPGAWPGRNWTNVQWQKFIDAMTKRGRTCVLVGTCKTYRFRSAVDYRMMTTPHQLAALMSRCSAFVGIDSFPAHVAGAMRTPRVVIFGITSAKYILCDSPNTVAVESDPNHPFTGARHSVERISQVKIGNPPDNPMTTIRTRHVLEAVETIL